MISKEVLKEIIISNEEFIQKQIRNIIPRRGIYIPSNLKKTVVFYGVRRSGKTFILFDLFKKYYDSSVYIDFEDERLVGFEMKDFERMKEAIFEIKPHLINKGLILFLDEIQNVDGWEKFCRRATERENIKIFVSGSSSKIMPFEIHTELRGRSWSIEVMPFSFGEYLQAKGLDISNSKLLYGTSRVILKNHFLNYLIWGGFPEVSLLESEFEKKKLLNEYISALFFRDMVERYNITNIALIETLMANLFSSFSLKFSLNSFYRQYKERISFSKDLLFRYYKNFIMSMIVFEVRKFSESTYVRMRNPAKIYIIDTGLAKRTSSQDSGRLLENLVYLELRRRGFEVFYFEEERECDFIVRKDGSFTPIQVTYEINDGNRVREIEGLIDACKYVGAKEGLVITYDDEDEFEYDSISVKVVPFYKWQLEDN